MGREIRIINSRPKLSAEHARALSEILARAAIGSFEIHTDSKIVHIVPCEELLLAIVPDRDQVRRPRDTKFPGQFLIQIIAENTQHEGQVANICRIADSPFRLTLEI